MFSLRDRLAWLFSPRDEFLAKQAIRLHCAERLVYSPGNLIKIKKSSEYVRRNHVLNIKQLMNNKKRPFITFYARLDSAFCVVSSIEMLVMQSALMCVNNKSLYVIAMRNRVCDVAS